MHKFRCAGIATLLVLGMMARSTHASDRVGFGGEIGYGIQSTFGGGKSNLQLAHLQVQLSTRLTGFSKENPHRGLENINELMFAESVRPGKRLVVGLNELFRYHFPVSARTSIHPMLGVGVTCSSLRIPELTGYLQFTPQAGVGITRYSKNGRMAYIVEGRFIHLSNNSTSHPNWGVNMYTLFWGFVIH